MENKVRVISTINFTRDVLPSCPPELIPEILSDPDSISKSFSGEEMKLAKTWAKKIFNEMSHTYRCPCCGRILKSEKRFLNNHWVPLRKGLSCGVITKMKS